MSGRFLSHQYIAAIRTGVEAGSEPVVAAHQALLAAADVALDQDRLCIRDAGGSPHFRQDGVYVEGKDGVRDPGANMESSRLAGRLSRTATDLALAWRFTDQARYADKALDLIHYWCINRGSYMFPDGRVEDPRTPEGKYGGDVVLFHSFWDLFLACYLLLDYPGWDLRPRAAVKAWIGDMIDRQRPLMFYDGAAMYNNWEDARLLYLTQGALALDDLDLLAQVFERRQQILPLKMTDEGELHRETMRTRSMSYTLASIHASLRIAEIARQHGVDLYDLTVNGRCFRTSVDYATRYLLDMDSWPHEMIHPADEDVRDSASLGAFELAYRQWGDERYLQAIDAWSTRPVVVGHATLLYGAAG